MKRIFILSALAILAFASCKKKTSTVSSIVTVSYPQITLSSARFFSVPVGGILPDANGIVATAYDSFYHEQIDVVVDASQVTSLKAGLYTITLSAKNKYGYKSYENVYVAVTDVADTVDIGGLYYGHAADGMDSLRSANVTKVSRGLYRTSNLAGVDTTGHPSTVVTGYFAMVDNATIDLGQQVIPGTSTSAANVITGSYGALDLVSIPNNYSYAFSDMMHIFGTGVRVFYKH